VNAPRREAFVVVDEETVERHRARIMGKLCVRSAAHVCLAS
jgi:FixJ family two-component response regulator